MPYGYVPLPPPPPPLDPQLDAFLNANAGVGVGLAPGAGVGYPPAVSGILPAAPQSHYQEQCDLYIQILQAIPKDILPVVIQSTSHLMHRILENEKCYDEPLNLTPAQNLRSKPRTIPSGQIPDQF